MIAETAEIVESMHSRAPSGPYYVVPDSATPAPDWTALVDRTSGWTGADGVYSVRLSEIDRLWTTPSNAKSFITFSDTFIGSVNANDSRAAGTYLINNSTALFTGTVASASNIVFNTRPGAGGASDEMFIGNPNGSWFWPTDGVVVGSNMYLYSLRMKAVSGGFGFDYEGLTLFSTPISQSNLNNNPPLFTSYSQIDNTGLFVAASGGLGSKVFGTAVMNNTLEAGSYRPDGYIYVYGVRNDAFNKKLLAARVPRTQIANLSQYRFYNGSTWVAGAANAAPISGGDHVSSEFSITPLPDGRYIMVYCPDDFLSGQVSVRFSNSPVGPWGAPTRVYVPPEDNLTPNTYVYGTKAHPAFSSTGELLISYHVNTFEFAEHFSHADIYHPRFLKLKVRQPPISPPQALAPTEQSSQPPQLSEPEDVLPLTSLI